VTEEHFRSDNYMRFIVFFLGMVALVDTFLSLIETEVIPHIIAHFNMSLSEFTFWQGMVGIFAFFVFLISWLGDHYGRRIGMFVLILSMSVPALLIGIIGPLNFTLFIILYGIMIMGTNVNFWAVPISEEAPAKRRGALGASVFLIGLIPLYAIIGDDLANAFGWQWTYGIFGIIGLSLLLLMPIFKETKRWEIDQEEFKQSKETFMKSLKLFNWTDWKFVVSAGFIYICWSTAFKFATVTLALYFQNVQGLTADQWDSIITRGGLMTLVGAISIGFIMERIGRVQAFIWSFGGSSLSFLGLALTGNEWFAILIYYYMSSVLGFMLVYNAEMLPTKIRGTGIGLLSTMSRVGFVIGPLSVSLIISDQTISSASENQFRTLYFLGSFVMFLAFMMMFVIKSETKGKTLEEIAEENSKKNTTK
jgi:MFS family permease